MSIHRQKRRVAIHFLDMQSVVCILIVDETLLLIQRRDIPVWTLPGGGIEPGETAEAAAVREMKEETGLTVDIVRKVAEYTPINRLARLTHFYEVRRSSGELATGAETAAVQFFSRSNLPPLLPPPYADWIDDAFLKSPQIIKKELTSLTYRKLLITFLQHPLLVMRFLLTKIGIHWNR